MAEIEDLTKVDEVAEVESGITSMQIDESCKPAAPKEEHIASSASEDPASHKPETAAETSKESTVTDVVSTGTSEIVPAAGEKSTTVISSEPIPPTEPEVVGVGEPEVVAVSEPVCDNKDKTPDKPTTAEVVDEAPKAAGSTTPGTNVQTERKNSKSSGGKKFSFCKTS